MALWTDAMLGATRVVAPPGGPLAHPRLVRELVLLYEMIFLQLFDSIKFVVVFPGRAAVLRLAGVSGCLDVFCGLPSYGRLGTQ